MLVLNRKIGESIRISDTISVTVLAVHRDFQDFDQVPSAWRVVPVFERGEAWMRPPRRLWVCSQQGLLRRRAAERPACAPAVAGAAGG